MISVIIATRGAEPSAMAQRYGNALSDIECELIVVNDRGRGVSWARNRGIDCAHGEWVIFVDDDDLMCPTMLSTMLKAAQDESAVADIVECGYRITGEGREQIVKLVDKATAIEGEELVKSLVECRVLTVNLWNKLIRCETIGDVRFDEEVAYGEDYQFLWRVVTSRPKCRVLVIPDVLYDYVQHPGQVSSQFTSAKLTMVSAWREIVAAIGRTSPQLLGEAHAVYASQLVVVLYHARWLHIPRLVTAPLRRELRRNLWRLLRSSEHSLKKKIAALYLSL